MRSKIVIQKPTDTSVGLIGVDSLLEVYDNTKSGDLVVVYPGTYDLGANGIKLKDGVNFLFMPGVVINSTNPNGAFYDDGVEVHCTIQGSPKIINGAGAAINLTNQSSSCPLNNKNLTVQNLPDPFLFNEGDIVTVEGGATYKHNGTAWKPLVDEYDFYFNLSNLSTMASELFKKDSVRVLIEGDGSPVDIEDLFYLQGTTYLEIHNIPIIRFKGGFLSTGGFIIAAPDTDIIIGSGESAMQNNLYDVDYFKDIRINPNIQVGQTLYYMPTPIASLQSPLGYKLVDTDKTNLSNFKCRALINVYAEAGGENGKVPDFYFQQNQNDMITQLEQELGNYIDDGTLAVFGSDVIEEFFLYDANSQSWGYPDTMCNQLTIKNSNIKTLSFRGFVGTVTLNGCYINTLYSSNCHFVSFSVVGSHILGHSLGSFCWIQSGSIQKSNIECPIFFLFNPTIDPSGDDNYNGEISIRSTNIEMPTGITGFYSKSKFYGSNVLKTFYGVSYTKYEFLDKLKTIYGASSITELFKNYLQLCDAVWIDGSPLNEINASLFLEGSISVDGKIGTIVNPKLVIDNHEISGATFTPLAVGQSFSVEYANIGLMLLEATSHNSQTQIVGRNVDGEAVLLEPRYSNDNKIEFSLLNITSTGNGNPSDDAYYVYAKLKRNFLIP